MRAIVTLLLVPSLAFSLPGLAYGETDPAAVASSWEPWAALLDVDPLDLPDAVAQQRGLPPTPSRCDGPTPTLADAIASLGEALGEPDALAPDAPVLEEPFASALARVVACIAAHVPHLPLHPEEAGVAPPELQSEWLAAARDLLHVGSDLPPPPVLTVTCVDTGCRIQLGGPGSDTFTSAAILSVDSGGADLYTNNAGGAYPLSLIPVSFVLDQGTGADRYWPTNSDLYGAPSIAGAYLGGVGILVDEGGHDHYKALGGAMGAAFSGAGFLLDRGGDDRYESFYAAGNSPGQSQKVVMGAGSYGGAGFLVDQQGNDAYLQEGVDSMGWGGAGGFGLLRDDSGHDNYTDRAALTGNGAGAMIGVISGVSMGVGEVGGVGLLLDGAGDDSYSCEGSVLWGCQGSGHWAGLGLLYDRAGNDDHFLAPHFDPAGQIEAGLGGSYLGGLGAFVDESGIDSYNSLAVHAGGYGELGGVGVFLDLGGAVDTYSFAVPPYTSAPAAGVRGNGQTWVGEAGAKGLLGFGADR